MTGRWARLKNNTLPDHFENAAHFVVVEHFCDQVVGFFLGHFREIHDGAMAAVTMPMGGIARHRVPIHVTHKGVFKPVFFHVKTRLVRVDACGVP